jgi:hypothetical protein
MPRIVSLIIFLQRKLAPPNISPVASIAQCVTYADWESVLERRGNEAKHTPVPFNPVAACMTDETLTGHGRELAAILDRAAREAWGHCELV